ncbi:MAG: DUF2202 domain-containing protein [Actinomycetes bacterium]
MNKSTKVALGISGGLVAVAAMAIPAVAVGNSASGSPGYGNAARAGTGTGTGTGTCDGTGSGNGTGMGRGAGMSESGIDLTGVASGTLTDAQRTAVAGMAEEEKLAHDLYVALGAKYPDQMQFQNIPKAETSHLASVRTLMTRYSIADPTAGKAAGEFSTPAVQALYDKLLAQGSANVAAALQAGVAVEKVDIADLKKAGAGVTAPDVTTVYSHLTTGSEHHLAAFKR